MKLIRKFPALLVFLLVFGGCKKGDDKEPTNPVSTKCRVTEESTTLSANESIWKWEYDAARRPTKVERRNLYGTLQYALTIGQLSVVTEVPGGVSNTALFDADIYEGQPSVVNISTREAGVEHRNVYTYHFFLRCKKEIDKSTAANTADSRRLGVRCEYQL